MPFQQWIQSLFTVYDWIIISWAVCLQRPQLVYLLLCLLFSHSPVKVPAEPSGFPRAARHWAAVLPWGRIRASAPAFPWRPGIRRHYLTDGEAVSEPRRARFGATVSKQKPGRKNGSLSRRPDYRSHSYSDLGSPAISQAATTCWWHVKEMHRWSHHELPTASFRNGWAGNYLGLLSTQTRKLGCNHSCFAFLFVIMSGCTFPHLCLSFIYQNMDVNLTLMLPVKINCFFFFFCLLALIKCQCKWLCLRLSKAG